MVEFLHCMKMRRRSCCVHPFQGFLLLWALMSSCNSADIWPTTTVSAESTVATASAMDGVGNSTHMGNSTMPPTSPQNRLMCSSFHCFGPQCYQNRSLYMHPTMNPPMNSTMMPPMMNATMNSTMDPTRMPPMNSSAVPPMRNGMYSMQCFNESFCELYRHNATHYSAGCSSHCVLGYNGCMVNGTMKNMCTMDCCNSSMCLIMNSTVYGDMLPTMPPTTTTMKTTTTPFPGNKKWCRTFSCDGAECFKGKESKLECRIGNDYCELKKKFSGASVSFTAGCSSSCAKAGIISCSGATTGDCYQECCNATTMGCCMKLDGSVHLNAASQLHTGSFLKLLLWAVTVILSSRLSILQSM